VRRQPRRHPDGRRRDRHLVGSAVTHSTRRRHDVLRGAGNDWLTGGPGADAQRRSWRRRQRRPTRQTATPGTGPSADPPGRDYEPGPTRLRRQPAGFMSAGGPVASDVGCAL
jgi:hypothetical protein